MPENDQDLDALARALTDPGFPPGRKREILARIEVRRAAGESLAPVLPAVRALLYHPDTRLRWAAADLLTPTDSWQYQNYTRAVEKLRAAAAREKIEGAEWLHEITVPDLVRDRDEREIFFAVPALTAAIFDEVTPVNQRGKVHRALFEALTAATRGDESIADALPAVVHLLTDPPAGRPWEAAQEEASHLLKNAATHKQDLGAFVARLEPLLAHDRDAVKFGVADALTMHHAHRDKWAAVERLLHHPDKDVRQEAAGTLYHGVDFQRARAVPALSSLVTDLHEDPDVRLVASRSLVRCAYDPGKWDPALPVVTRALQRSELDTRKYALGILNSMVRGYETASGEDPGEVPVAEVREIWARLEPLAPVLEAFVDEAEPVFVQGATRCLIPYYLRLDKEAELLALLDRVPPDAKDHVKQVLDWDDWEKPPAVTEWWIRQDAGGLVARIKEAAGEGVTELDLSARDLDQNPILELPPEIGTVTTLTRLDLSQNKLRTLPPEIGQLEHLETLIATGNQLETLPPEIGQLRALKSLFLYRNRLRALPAEFGQLHALRYLQLIQNELERLPPEFGQLRALETLEVHENRLEQLPEEFGQLSHLERVDLRENQLTSLPESLVGCKNLVSLNVGKNPLPGIPPVVFQMTQLQSLGLGFLNLTEIPAALGALHHLHTLDVYNNALTSLPDVFDQFPEFEYLNASANQLRALPPTMRALVKIGAFRWMDLGRNPLPLPEHVVRACTRPKQILRAYFETVDAAGGTPNESPEDSPEKERQKK